MSYQSIKEIPSIGFGLWKIPESTCADVVYEAVKQGYRHFDSASDYGNEKEAVSYTHLTLPTICSV